jgi:hypothetical protein
MPTTNKGPKAADLEPYGGDPVLWAISTGGRIGLAEATDPEVVQQRIFADIMAADDAASILGAGSATKAEDVLGLDLLLEGVEWRDSDEGNSGPGVYALLHVVTREGEKLTVSCGAGDVVFRVRKLELSDVLPTWVKLTKATKPTAAGYYPLNIGPGQGPDAF